MKRNLFIILAVHFAFSSWAQESFGGLMFSARLDTTQHEGQLWVPSSGNAVAGFSHHDDTLWFEITANGLTGPITAAHIHSDESGSVEYSLNPFIDGNKLKGYLTEISFNNGKLKDFLEGAYYVNIHTASNPDGEIRGRIIPETDHNYLASLDMIQAGNSIPSDQTPIGLGSFNLGMDHTELEINLLVNDLTAPITNAHLHYGSPGQSGPVIVPLSQFNNGNNYKGIFDLTGLANPSAFLDSLKNGKVYVNVHTSNFPAGEIRGQLMKSAPLSFDTWMDPGQETTNVDPATPEDAMAICNFYVNSSLDSIWLNVVADQLSGPIQSAHFHNGKAGNSGPVVVDLNNFIQGNQISGLLTPSSPNFVSDFDFDEFVRRMLSDDIYINIHTSLNPAGEVRGQPASLSREGVIYSLCPGQEVAAVTGGEFAQGSGFVSLDRKYTNLHYGHAVSRLSSTISMSHFHHALPGVNGPVVFPLPADSVMMGFWNDASFTDDIADQFESGEMYANFHTTLNPAGEVRGQVEIVDFCETVTAVNEEILPFTYSMNIYPNPISSSSIMAFSIPKSGLVSVTINDLLGNHKKVLVDRLMKKAATPKLLKQKPYQQVFIFIG
ncbi:MAG: CHRD domain-containing protein [Bacteroidales bacterium]|nr:CHRD domain-containing protein [Bacteroidales bacterium]